MAKLDGRDAEQLNERSLTTSVNDIEHIKSQSIPNCGIITIFFQPTVNINAALAEVSAMSQTVLKQMPAGIPAQPARIKSNLVF